MTKLYGPFDAGAGSAMTENNWRKMAQMFAETGVLDGYLNELEVFADSTGMQVKVPSGLAYVKGHFFESDAQETIAIAANASGNPRIDRVVLEANFSTNSIDFVVVAGTPAGSPTAPALTQNLTAVWQMPLATVDVANGASTIAAGDVTDERGIDRVATVATAETTTSTTYADLATPGPMVKAVVGISGKALVILSADIQNDTAAAYAYASVAVSGASTVAAADARSLRRFSNSANDAIQASRAVLFSGLTPGLNTFTMKYRQVGGTGSFESRELCVLPLL